MQTESIILCDEVKAHFSARASLAAIGMAFQQRGIFAPITKHVHIAQKTVKYSPTEKLQDVLINLLCGAQGMVEINKRVKPDAALQRAFGREGCAEQSVVQDSLDACTEKNVEQMYTAQAEIFRRHSQAYRHDYSREWQILDVDLTGRPCGKKAAFASKGYFSQGRNRRGRQVGYVVATWYKEIVVERVVAGKQQLSLALCPLMEATEKTLGLDRQPWRRQRTLVRIDAGGGSVADINWLLQRGYQVHAKDYAAERVKVLVKRVETWITDPKDSQRQVGWVTAPHDLYHRPVRRIAVRCRKKNGQWGMGVIVSSLAPRDVLWLTGQSLADADDPQAVLLAYMYFYDQRGGGVEIEIKEDKQGLGTSKRNKKRFEAQQMLTQLEALAHNLLVWARSWLATRCPEVAQWGIKRLVRDVFQINGKIVLDHTTQPLLIVLNQADPVARKLYKGLAALLAQQHVVVTLGEI
jgi:hypothetical protein